MSGKEELSRPKVLMLFGFMLVAGFMRALPMPPNFAPIGAMALFGGAYFVDKRLAYLLPLVAMLFSDLLLEVMFQVGIRQYSGFHEQMIGVYAGFIGTVFIGTLLNGRIAKVGVVGVAAASLAASVWFFLVSNLNVWVFSSVYYTRDFAGLISCYTMAIPFFRNSIAGDLFYCAIMFGSFEVIKYKFPKLALAK